MFYVWFRFCLIPHLSSTEHYFKLEVLWAMSSLNDTPRLPYGYNWWKSPCFPVAGKPKICVGSKSKIGGAQWQYVIKILWKFHQISFSGMRGVADKRWVPQSVTDGRTDGINDYYIPSRFSSGGYNNLVVHSTKIIMITSL